MTTGWVVKSVIVAMLPTSELDPRTSRYPAPEVTMKSNGSWPMTQGD